MGQEAHAFNLELSADRYRLRVTLIGGAGAFLVPATMLGGADACGLSTLLRVFVVVLGGWYRWQASVWRLVVIHLQTQRFVVSGARAGPVGRADNDRA